MKIIKPVIFWLVWYSGMARVYFWLSRKKLRILCYHSIADSVSDDPTLTVSPAVFRNQIAWLGQHAHVVKLANAVNRLSRRQEQIDYSVALTFDDGYEDNFLNAQPPIQEYQVPATIFLTIKFLKSGQILFPKTRHPSKVTLSKTELSNLGSLFDFGSHTLTHPSLATLGAEAQRKELSSSKVNLEKLLSRNIDLLAYPFGKNSDFNKITQKLARQIGYQAAFTTEEGTIGQSDNRFALKRIVIFNEPLFMFKVRVSGVLDDLLNFVKISKN